MSNKSNDRRTFVKTVGLSAAAMSVSQTISKGGAPMAGRCISATHVAASAGKSMGNCVATGHAAGIAAAMSAKKICVPRELNVTRIQDALRADNVDLTRGGEDQSSYL